MRRLRRYRCCCCCRAVADAASSAIDSAASVAVDRNTHAAILDGAAYAATVVADAGYTWSAAAGRCQCTVVGGERAPPVDAAISVGGLWAGRTWTMFAAADGAAAGVPPR